MESKSLSVWTKFVFLNCFADTYLSSVLPFPTISFARKLGEQAIQFFLDWLQAVQSMELQFGLRMIAKRAAPLYYEKKELHTQEQFYPCCIGDKTVAATEHIWDSRIYLE
ncbi:MAG: hypothetical protein RR415_13990, partial [Ruthenibacterium sp.]